MYVLHILFVVSCNAYIKKKQLHVLIFYVYSTYPTVRKLHWDLNYAISLMGNLLNFDSVNCKIFMIFSMMASITKIQKSKSPKCKFVILTILGKVPKLNSVYVLIL